MSNPFKLIVGLGNPGAEYASTRHNAGEWWLRQVVDHLGGCLAPETKFMGEVAKLAHPSWKGCAVFPTLYMNRSGQSVAALARFYKIEPHEILVAHDELDLPCGSVRLKRGGGHGGHNGLRDLIAHLGADFWRLRIGIDHPGHKDLVTDYVLHQPSKVQRGQIDDAITLALQHLEPMLAGKVDQVMNALHAVR